MLVRLFRWLHHVERKGIRHIEISESLSFLGAAYAMKHKYTVTPLHTCLLPNKLKV